MRAGKLFHPVEIQQYTIVDDGYGSGNKTWSKFASARAAIWPQKSVEMVIDGKLTMVTRFTIRIRAIAGITTGMRVVKTVDSRVFEILGFRNYDERGRKIDLNCKEDV